MTGEVQLAERVSRPSALVPAAIPDNRYRLDVMAASAVEVVCSAGGWLFDRVMAGWEVTVLVAGDVDDRPLRILGVDTADLQSVLASPKHRPRPRAMAVATQVYRDEPRVRQGVLDALADRRIELTLWGDKCPAELARHVNLVTHPLGSAARTFKAEALLAAGVAADTPVGQTEVFRAVNLICRPESTELDVVKDAAATPS